VSRWRKRMISAALVLYLDKASTGRIIIPH